MKRVAVILLLVLPNVMLGQIDSLKSIQFIYNNVGGLVSSTLDGDDKFGRIVEVIGDVNQDGVDDIAVGAHQDDDGITNQGAVYILMLNADGTVKDQQKISATTGNGPSFDAGHIGFGTGIAALGDLNGDGKVDIAVGGGNCDDDGVASYKGAVYILFLDTNGSVLEYQKISNTQGGGPGSLATQDAFGSQVANIGDLNGDGLPEVAIQALRDDDGGTNVGAVYIGFLDYNGTLKDIQKISATSGGFGGTLTAGDQFGFTRPIGDLDGDGITDIVIGANADDDGGSNRGAVWICFMNADGTVSSEQKISDTAGSFTGTLDNVDRFGVSVLGIGDLNNDGVLDIAVGAPGDDDGGTDKGAIWFLYLDTDGTVQSYDKISTSDNLLTGFYGSDFFGSDIVSFGDRNNDGIIDLLLGVKNYVDGGAGIASGAVIVAHIAGDTTYPSKNYHTTTPFINSILKHSAATSPLDGELGALDYYGRSITSIGDLDGDGNVDIVVGAHLDDDGGTDKGSIYIQFLNADRSIKSLQKVNDTEGNFSGTLDSQDRFGVSVCSLGDLDGDSIVDIAVGSFWDDDGYNNAGAIWILFMTDSGYVKSHQKISATQGNFSGTLQADDWFGYALTSAGDIDGDGTNDLITSSRRDDDGYTDAGAVWVLFMTDSGYVKSHQKISATQGNFSDTLSSGDEFGFSISTIGDINNNGVHDVAVGAWLDDEANTDAGAVYILFLNDTGAVDSSKKITTNSQGFISKLYDSDKLGISVNGTVDFDQDGNNDLLVGTANTDDAGDNKGTIWLLNLNPDGTIKTHKLIGATSAYLIGEIDENDGFSQSIGVLNSISSSNLQLLIGTIRDDDGSTDAGAVYIVDIDLSVLQDYSNNIFIDTRSFSEAIPYSLELEGSIYSYATGGIESILITDTSNTDTAIVTVEATSSYGALELLFDVDGTQISNVRIVADSLGGGDTLALDSNLYTISSNGQVLTLYERDTNDISTDSLLYGFELQGGLGFSPDEDGDYDELVITGLDNIFYFNLTIKDLENTTVFYTEDKSDFWNGKYMGSGSLMNRGTYQYTLNVNGETLEGQILLDY